MELFKFANLALRFFLELCMLAALGYWGWSTGESWSGRLGLRGGGTAAGCRCVGLCRGSARSRWGFQAGMGVCAPGDPQPKLALPVVSIAE